MRAVVQLVKESSVKVEENVTGKIKNGFLVLLGISQEDEESDVIWALDKLVKLRVFNDDNGKMNRSLIDINGAVLLVSQFTLFASIKKGNRPSFIKAAAPELANKLYDFAVNYLKSKYKIKVETGVFGATMEVSLINYGPVTITIDSKNRE
tara:strand:+ start:31 stop:483 length:453 start_codon:yes stop_codon:yes gene_type:complete